MSFANVNMGVNAGNLGQGGNAIAIGFNAGANTQGGGGGNCIAVGVNAGQYSQNGNCIAIGFNAGMTGQGVNAIAIGSAAGMTGQTANSIVINATGGAINGATANACYIAPIRNINNSNTNYLQYNTGTYEISWGSSEVSKRVGASGGTPTISFPFTFASIPTVVCTMETGRTDYFWTCQLLSVSTTGFQVRVQYSNGSSFTYGAGGGDNYTINYIAKLTN